MPFTPRKIDWRLLVDPTMRGLALEADANARMNQNIMSGLLNVGQGIQRGAANRESKRRFGLQEARASRAEEERMAEALARKEFAAGMLIDGVTGQDEQKAKTAVSVLGGPDAAGAAALDVAGAEVKRAQEAADP